MIDPTLVVGALELERTDRGLLPHRLPAWARAQSDDPQLPLVEAQPAGVRLALRTAPPASSSTCCPPSGATSAPLRGLTGGTTCSSAASWSSGLQAPGGDVLDVDMMTGASPFTAGEPTTLVIALPAGAKDVEVWLPHDEQTELIDLRADGDVEPLADDRPRWVHHGSSISHGSVRDPPHRAVAGRGRPAGRSRPGQPRPRWQRAARPLRRAHHPRHPRRPDQPQARHQPGQPGPAARRALGPAVHG